LNQTGIDSGKKEGSERKGSKGREQGGTGRCGTSLGPENGPTGISQTEWRGTDLLSGEVSLLPWAGSAGSTDSAAEEAEAAEAAEALRSSCT